MDHSARDAIIRSRAALLVSSPFYGCLALHLNLVEVEDEARCPTMAVDGYNLYYHPKFVKGLSEQELVGVNAHEVTHCAYLHMTRRGHRDPYLWNVAADYRINWDIKEAGFTLPGKPIAWNSNPKPPKAGQQPEMGHLYDVQFKDMSTEEIYEKIKQDVDKACGGKGPEMIKITIDPNGCGVVWDANGGGDPARAEKAAREWEGTVRMAINVAKNAGHVPGHLKRLVEQLQEPKVNWKDLTRNFIDRTTRRNYSWTRPNRRFASSGIILPGFMPDTMHKIIMCIDCSGSISDEMLRIYVSEVAGALDEGITDELIVVYADTDVHKVDTFTPGDMVTCSTVGGGGTDFDNTFKWIKANHPDAGCIIYLTDMMTSSFGQDPDVPTLWAAFCPKQTLAQYKPSFGEVIEVNTGD